MIRAIALIPVLFLLSGCLLMTGPGLFMAGVATIVNTNKTPSDHVVSLLVNQDCSTVEYSKGEDYCKSKEQDAGDGDQYVTGPYCYRTLGESTCYSSPDPLASGQARLR